MGDFEMHPDTEIHWFMQMKAVTSARSLFFGKIGDLISDLDAVDQRW
jgi:hypothetical protein